MKLHHFRYEKMYVALLGAAAGLALLGFCFSTPAEIVRGFYDIATRGDVLITDYMETAGMGAAFVNAALIMAISILLLYATRDPVNGFTPVTVGLMAGFAFFGKNIFNIWPILAGGWLYAKVKREPFSKYVSVALLSTSLSPLVSYVMLETGDGIRPLEAVVVGLLIGFIMPSLAAYTFRIQNGMNLYNAGFACGVLAMVLVPILSAYGRTPESVLHWSTGHNGVLALILYGLCAVLAAAAFVLDPSVWKTYLALLKTSGRAPSDYLRAFGAPAVLLNAAVNGVIATSYVLLTGGDLNGPTLGGVITIISFGAWGKHAGNIIPLMLGVLIGGITNHLPFNTPSLQLAGLFCTTLAPVAGVFGWPAGLLAGFLHSCVVLRVGMPLEGVNLYNNGFSGGMIAMVLYPFLTAMLKKRKPGFLEEDYYNVFEEDTPLAPEDVDHHPEEEKMG